jgi:hypothetical protein
MVEVRKANELRAKDDQYPILAFFCDWLLHPVLNRGKAQTILKKFDEFIGAHRRGLVEEKHVSVIHPLVDFSRLHRELIVFLSESELSLSAVDGHEWLRFLSLYIDQIARAEVRTDDPANLGLRHIDSVQIKKSLITCLPPEAAEGRFNFRVVWTFRQGGQPVFKIESEIWSPDNPASVQVPVSIILPDGSTRALKAETFFGDKE